MAEERARIVEQAWEEYDRLQKPVRAEYLRIMEQAKEKGE